MNIWKREIVMSATVDYSHEARSKGQSIGPKTRFEDNSNSKLEDEVKEIISSRLPSDMAQIYGMTLRTRVITTKYGSLIVFFGVLLSGFTFIANYKGFFDSIHLIREHLGLLLTGRLRERFSDQLEISVSVEYPKLDDPREMRFPSELRRLFRHMPFEPEFSEAFNFWQLMAHRPQRRDAFFWFLLLISLSLIGVVGVLVFAAVKKTYFP